MAQSIRPDNPLAPEIRRIGGAETDKALQALAAEGNAQHAAIHSARQSYKRLRGLLRLIRPASEAFYADQNRRLRDAGRGLAGARNLTAMIEAVDRIAATEKSPQAFAGVRTALEAERATFAARQEDFVHDLSAARGKTAAAGDAFAQFRMMPGTTPAAFFGRGVAATYRQARKAFKRARRARTSTAFHELRKQTKYHHAHLRLLSRFALSGKRHRRAVKDLADCLGELHDIDMLLDRIDGEPLLAAPAKERAGLRKALRAERDRLVPKVLKMAAPLFRSGPRRYHRKAVKRLSRRP